MSTGKGDRSRTAKKTRTKRVLFHATKHNRIIAIDAVPINKYLKGQKPNLHSRRKDRNLETFSYFGPQ